MGSKIYNSKDEQKFEQLIKDLKGIPKVKAEENFEFNLMVKIRNKNFGLNGPEKSFFLSRRLVPAATFAFSLIVIFFIVSEQSTSLENPLLSEPLARENYSYSKVDTIELTKPNVAAIPTVVDERVADKTQVPNQNVVRVMVEPSDAVTIEEVELPFDDVNAVDLDSFVKGEAQNSTSSVSRGRIVSGGQTSQFDGFLVREKASKEAIDAHRAKLDSLKKAKKSDKK